MAYTQLQYQPLDPKKSEIRVLNLSPSSDANESVHCSLSHVSLDERPTFEALSYVWGPPTPTNDIFINGAKFTVGPSLHAALKGLRQRNRPRTIWADAICINQNDDADKRYQVPLMGRLYTEATRTVIWFGDSNEEIDALMVYLSSHNSSRNLMPTNSSKWLKLGAKRVCSDKAGRDKAEREKELLILKAANGYFDLLSRPYWYRMWTFQEYMLPRGDPLCLCGAHEFNMSSVDEVRHQMIEAISEVKQRVNTKLSSAGVEKDESFMTFAETVARQMTDLGQKSTAESGGSVFAIRKAFRSQSRGLAYFLGMTSERNCTVGHDRFYALYGIVPALQSVSPVDYRKPIREVFLEIASYVVNDEKNKNIYSNFGLMPNHLCTEKDFPSWIPDFARENDTLNPDCYTAEDRLPNSLCENALQEVPLTTVDNFVELRSHGFVIGTVTQVRKIPAMQPEMFAELHALVSGEECTAVSERQRTRSSKRAERWAAAISSHMGDWLEREIGPDSVNLNIVQTVESIHDQFARGDRPQCTLPWTPRRLENEFQYLAGRTTFVTDTGLLGLGVTHIQEGDVVTILNKENLPVILRPVLGEIGQIDDLGYNMVGTAYVDGVMDNEWLDGVLVEDVSKQETSEFRIQ